MHAVVIDCSSHYDARIAGMIVLLDRGGGFCRGLCLNLDLSVVLCPGVHGPSRRSWSLSGPDSDETQALGIG